MKLKMYSYRYAKEILEHKKYRNALHEIVSATKAMPLFVYEGKSKNKKLDVVQKVQNTYFDRALAVDRGWTYHPLATSIVASKLAADFRKTFGDLTIQAEVQFGNMSRWYSDVFKFQTAYSQNLIDMGLCIVPTAALARRIDSNIAYYERVLRELPSAELSITLPILVIGVEPDNSSNVIDLRQVPIPLAELKDKGRKVKGSPKSHTELNRYRLVNAVLSGLDPYQVTEGSEHGALPVGEVDVADDDD
jgi:hypothetical protein